MISMRPTGGRRGRKLRAGDVLAAASFDDVLSISGFGICLGLIFLRANIFILCVKTYCLIMRTDLFGSGYNTEFGNIYINIVKLLKTKSVYI